MHDPHAPVTPSAAGPLAAATELCTFCPRLCSHACPVSLASAREALTPQAKMASLALLQKAPDEATAAELAPPLYGCTGCGACTTACLHHVEPGSVLMRGRALAGARYVVSNRIDSEVVLARTKMKDLPAAVSNATPDLRAATRNSLFVAAAGTR